MFLCHSWHVSVPVPTAKEVAVTLDSNTTLSRDAISGIISVWGESNSEEAAATVNIKSICTGKLENLKWRIGVAMHSSVCKNIMNPYVSLSFNVRNENGELTCHNIELSYAEFQVRLVDIIFYIQFSFNGLLCSSCHQNFAMLPTLWILYKDLCPVSSFAFISMQ